MNAHEQRLVDELRSQLPQKNELSRLRSTVQELRRRINTKNKRLLESREELAAERKAARLLRREVNRSQETVERLTHELAIARHALDERAAKPESLSDRWPRLTAAQRRSELRARIAPRRTNA